jgi:hypothetical protein
MMVVNTILFFVGMIGVSYLIVKIFEVYKNQLAKKL